MHEGWLIAAGVLDAVAALLHLGCIVGGARWYRFFGAGERMARMVERGEWRPHLLTLGIVAMLGLWAVYALAGGGVLPRPLLLRAGLVAITLIYLARAAALPLMIRAMPDRSRAFLYWSSAIVLVLGTLHGVGLWTGWAEIG